MFLYHNIDVKKMFFSVRELKKALRDTLTRAAWLGPSNVWFVRSEDAHASYPGLSFRLPGSSFYRGREERRVQELDYWKARLDLDSFSSSILSEMSQTEYVRQRQNSLYRSRSIEYAECVAISRLLFFDLKWTKNNNPRCHSHCTRCRYF